MHWLDKAVAGALPLVPKGIVRRVSSRYIAGETLDDAVTTVRSLNRQGLSATLDVLGEFVTTEAEARRAGTEYLTALAVIQREGLDSNISVKLTQMGLKLDPELAFEITRGLVEEARRQGNFVRLDMEDSSCTDDTLRIHERLHALYPGSVGCVIQAYLKRSRADVQALVGQGTRVRLCKGIYLEPPEIAYRNPREVNRSFETLLEMLLQGGAHTAIATHDDQLVEAAYGMLTRFEVPRDRVEFQMLLGVREPLRDAVLGAGHRLRVYVPFGSHWYAYSLRRLKENPQIAGHVFRGMLNGRK